MFSEQTDVQMPHYVECGSFLATRAMLMSSDHIALSSVHQASYELEKGDLVVVDQCPPEASRSVGITSRKNWKPTRVQSEFLRLLNVEVARMQMHLLVDNQTQKAAYG